MKRAIAPLLVFLAGSALAIFLGASWAQRINRTEGIHLVEGIDPGPSVKIAPPRHTIVAVIDGLGFFEAEAMTAATRMRQMGRCMVTSTGEPSISRAMYTVISSGVEQGRTGIRNNATHTKAAVESIWETARSDGLEVSVISEIPWWVQLFPGGFKSYKSMPRARNFFTDAPRTQLTLVHTLYVDETGHESGAQSRAYAEEVARADRELNEALDELDVKEDLLVVTADHGHAALGGHGGPAPRVATVLTCFVGRGIAPASAMDGMRSTAIAPALAVLLGVRFPKHMRAEDSELAPIWPMLDEKVFPRDYVASRQSAIKAMRAQQESALRIKHAATLAELEQDGARWQLLRALLGACLFLGLILVGEKRVFGAKWRHAFALHVAWLAFISVVCVVIFVYRRESFDLTAPNNRDEFLRETSLMCGLVAAVPVVIALVRARDRVLVDQVFVMLLLGAGNVLHPVALGWELGFPLPPSWLMFFPFFAAVLMWSAGSVGVFSALLFAALFRRDGANTPGARSSG